MELPKLKSTNIKELKIGKQNITIQSWSNRDMLQYQNIKEDIENDKLLSEEEIRYKTDDAILKYLLLPNIVSDRSIQTLSTINQKKIFVEMYKLSRGSVIEGKYECVSCYEKNKEYSSFEFDIDRDYKFHEMQSTRIEAGDFTFNLKDSNFNRSDYDIDDNTLGVRYILSYIKSFKYDGQVYNGLKDEEIYNWCLEELPEGIFNELIIKLQDVIPKIEISMEVSCEHCKENSILEFNDIPDFSITVL